MKSKEKKKILNSLMAFYQIICGLYDGLEKIADPILQGVIFKEHILYLLAHHKEFIDKNKILIPEIDKMYGIYCAEFTKKVVNNQSLLEELEKKYKKRNDVGYIT